MTRALPACLLALSLSTPACGDDAARPTAHDASIDAGTADAAQPNLDASARDARAPAFDATSGDAGPVAVQGLDAGPGSCSLGDYRFPDGSSILWTDGCNTGTCAHGQWAVTAVLCLVETPELATCLDGDPLSDDLLSVGYRDGTYLVVEMTGAYCASASSGRVCRDANFVAGASPSIALHAVVTGQQPCARQGVPVQLDDLSMAARQQFPSATSLVLRVGEASVSYPL